MDRDTGHGCYVSRSPILGVQIALNRRHRLLMVLTFIGNINDVTGDPLSHDPYATLHRARP